MLTAEEISYNYPHMLLGNRLLGADHSTSEGGGGGGWVIFKKNILQVHMHKKKILAQDHRAKKNSCTYSGLEKKFWQDVL